MIRRWLLALLLVGFIWMAVTHLPQIQELVQTLARGQWLWVLAAVACQVAYFLILTGSYQAAFATVGVAGRLRELLPVTLGAIFVNTLAPMGGAAGTALFVDDAVRRGQPAPRTATGMVLQQFADYGAFALVMLAGLAYLFTRHDLNRYEVIAAAILLLLVTGLGTLLVLALAHPAGLHRLLAWAQRALRRLAAVVRRPPPVPADWAEKNAREFIHAAATLRAQPQQLARTVGYAVGAHVLDLATVYALFLAFVGPVALGTLVAGYAVGILFGIVSPTPMGVVEGAMTLVFSSLGISASVATAVVLAFRGMTFWLPMAIGFVLLRRLRSFAP